LANTNGLVPERIRRSLARLPSAMPAAGMPGTYTRLTAEAQWRRSFTDSIGQIWTRSQSPASMRSTPRSRTQTGRLNFLPVRPTPRRCG